jgi:hypothetical protein
VKHPGIGQTKESKPMAIRISAVGSSRLSEDQKELVVDSTGKYTGSLELRFARECIDDLIRELTRAKAALQPGVSAALATTRAALPAASAEPHTRAATASASNNPDEVRFEIPRNCTITADTSGRGMVLFILNHKLERQAGYAFSPDAAKQLAGALVKSADALLSSKRAAIGN